jgi:hypothetical protein
MKTYKCIKGFAIDTCDGDGFTIENKQFIIEKQTAWYVPENEDYRFIGGEVRLENDYLWWIEISKENLEEHFREV